MLVQPDQQRPQDMTSSVKLRRKNRDHLTQDADKKRNRFSGGDFLLGSPARNHMSRPYTQHQPASMQMQQHELMRKSGDWSYVSFPASSKSPPVTPKLSPKGRPLSLMQQQPISLLETKVMASIIHNESKRGQKSLEHQRHNHSTHGTPLASQKRKPIEIQPTAATESESKNNSQRSSKLKSEQDEEEYTKLLRRRMISEVLQKKQLPQQQSDSASGVWQTPTRRDPKRRPQQRRSQSAQGRKNETQSEVNLPPHQPSASSSSSRSPQKGLGRRSVTQLELSRRKRTDQETGSEHMQKAKWHSQENLDKVKSPETPVFNNGNGGNFAGGRKELAMRLLSMPSAPNTNQAEEETKSFTGQDDIMDAEDDDEDLKMLGYGAPSSLLSCTSSIFHNENSSQLRKGILWQQRDKIFSRWKERFFVLTKDYLQCFKKGTSRITEMGGFIYGIRLSEIVDVQLLDKRGYLTICLTLASKDGKLFLRRPEGIREWFQALKASAQASKERKSMLSTEEFWSRKQFEDNSNGGGAANNIEQWLIARQRIDMKYNYGSSWDRDQAPKSLQVDLDNHHRRCRTPRSAPNSRPQSSTRSSSASRPSQQTRRSLSQHPNPSNLEHVYETPKHEGIVTSPSSSARSSRLSAGSNGFFRDSGNDTMYTSSGGSTDSSNRDQLKHAHRQQQRRHSETKRISASSNLDNYPSASSTPKKSPFHRHLPSQATRV